MQRDSQKTFQSTHLQYLPWIYCSNTHCTMVLWQKCGIFTVNFITGVKVYNYSMHMCQGSVVCVMCSRLLCPYLVCFLSLFHVIMS